MFCRSEATKLHEQKPAINAAGCDLVCLLKENIPEEVSSFHTEDYWPTSTPLYLDDDMTFFKALGGGKVRKGSLMGFLNPFSGIYKRAKKIQGDVKESNLKGEGTIMGGLYVISNQGIHYQHIEEDFGVAAPIDEVIEACKSVTAAAGGGSGGGGG